MNTDYINLQFQTIQEIYISLHHDNKSENKRRTALCDQDIVADTREQLFFDKI